MTDSSEIPTAENPGMPADSASTEKPTTTSRWVLNAVEARVLGCLIEKQITTPDLYPLTLNSLTLACNQKSNRDPVLELEEQAVVRALDGLREKKLAQMVSLAGSRVMKYGHQAERTLALETPALALLCELLVRGPQTVGELRGHTARMVPFASIEVVEKAMSILMARQPEPLATLLPRLPGRKEPRYAHLLSGAVKVDELAAASVPTPEKARVVVQAENERMSKLEADLAGMRQEMAALQAQVTELRKLLE